MKHRSPHWHFAARLAALITVLSAFGITLVVAGPGVLYGFALVCFLVYVFGLIYLLSRPETQTDRYCAEVDRELDERQRQARQERAAASDLRVHRNVTALPQRPPAEVIELRPKR